MARSSPVCPLFFLSYVKWLPSTHKSLSLGRFTQARIITNYRKSGLLTFFLDDAPNNASRCPCCNSKREQQAGCAIHIENKSFQERIAFQEADIKRFSLFSCYSFGAHRELCKTIKRVNRGCRWPQKRISTQHRPHLLLATHCRGSLKGMHQESSQFGA